jgi:hypothetical protein
MTSLNGFPNPVNKNHPFTAFLSPHHAWTLRPMPNGCWRANPATDVPPPGKYRATLIDSKVVDIPTGNGLQLTWRITSGRFAGREVMQHLDVIHCNPKIQKLAQEHLKAICDAAGVRGLIRESEELHGAKAMIRTALVNGDEPIVVDVIACAAAFGGGVQ